MADIESPLIFETAALNVNSAPEGMPPSSSPNIVYSEGRESLAMLKRWWNRVNPTVTSGGSANAQTLTYSVAPTEGYKTGQTFTFIAGFSNSGACTLNVNGLGAKAIQLNGAPLAAGAIIAGSITQCIYDGTQFQLTLAVSGAYLPLGGGTLTGALTINAPITIDRPAGSGRAFNGMTAGSIRWQAVLGSVTAESGGNAGSDFQITRFTDGGVAIDTPLTINRASGQVTLIGPLAAQVGSFTNTININGANGSIRQILGQTAGSNRWQLGLGNSVSESGSNNGSDFTLISFTDAAAPLATPITVKRSTGVTTFSVAIVNGPSDRSLKENIAPLEDSLDKVMALQGVSFDFIKDETKRRQIGLIAQDVAPIVPEVMQDFIQPDEEPKLAIDYTRLVPLLVEAIKELTAKVTTLEAKLAAAPT